MHTGIKAGRAVLLVANSGPVIAPREVDRLLRPFERLGSDRTGQRAGLGLAIVAAIAEAPGATLAVRPPADGGLEVDVAFPAHSGDGGVAGQNGRVLTLGTSANRRDRG
ncbi:MAG TPA: ATP-binding protein [Streptosporangiaceae bacterium]|nr:ATP-binding protein [Streptosporangiaceae bacterium]